MSTEQVDAGRELDAVVERAMTDYMEVFPCDIHGGYCKAGPDAPQSVHDVEVGHAIGADRISILCFFLGVLQGA